MFLAGRVWPQLLSHLGMQLKVWLVHKTSVHLGQTAAYTNVSLFSYRCFIVRMSKWQKNVMRKELRDWCKKGNKDREPKCSHYSVKFAVRSINMKEQQLAKQRTFCYVTSIGCLQTMNTYSSQIAVSSLGATKPNM